MATACSAAVLICCGSVISNDINLTPEMFLSSASVSGFRMVAITFHPLDANSLAVALPSPEEAPVMKMLFPVRSFIASFLHPPAQQHLSRRRPHPTYATGEELRMHE